MSDWEPLKTTDFTQGYIDKVDDTKLAAGALKDCRNMISRQIGRIVSRGGQKNLNSTELGSSNAVQGLHPFYLNGTKYLVVVVAGIVYSCTPPDGTMTQIKTGLDATAPVLFTTAYIDGKNQIIGFNGINTPFKWDGTTVADLNDYRIVSRETPTTSDYLTYTLLHKPLRIGSSKFFVFSNDVLLNYADYVLDDTGDGTQGTFTFASARLNAVTPYTDTSAATVTYPLNGRIELQHPFIIDATHPVTIYDKSGNVLKALTDENASADWKADAANGVVTAPLTLDYTNLMPLYATFTWPDVLKVDYQYSNGTVATQFRHPVAHRGRIFVMGGDEHIYWSDITENGSEYEAWPPVNNWPVNQGKGESDGCMIPLINDLYVFMSKSIHRFRGTDLTDFNLTVVDPSVGCAGPRAACLDGDIIYFVSEEGLCSFNGVEVTNLSEARCPGMWDRINKTYLSNAVVYPWDGLILFALPLDTSTINDLVMVYDPSAGAFWPWNSIYPSCYAEISTTSGAKLYSGNNEAGYIVEQDVGDDDNGTNIISYFNPAVIDGGAADKMKKSRNVIVEHGEDQTTWADVYASKNNTTALKLTTINADLNMRKYATRPTIAGKWRYMGLQVKHDQAGPFEVRSITLEVKIKNKSSVKGAVT